MKKQRKYEKRESANEDGIKSYKFKKMAVSNASRAIINALCYTNGTGNITLCLDSHLDPNSIHWECVIKHDSDYKKCKNNTCLWHNCIKYSNNIDRCKELMTSLKMKKISSDIHEQHP